MNIFTEPTVCDICGGADEDSEHYIYEAAMEAVFGEKVWDYINGQE